MDDNLLTKDSEQVIAFFATIHRLEKGLEELSVNCKPASAEQRYMTDKEVSELLKISRRTLREYRAAGKIPYYKLGGKMLYDERDIDKLLRSNRSESVR